MVSVILERLCDNLPPTESERPREWGYLVTQLIEDGHEPLHESLLFLATKAHDHYLLLRGTSEELRKDMGKVLGIAELSTPSAVDDSLYKEARNYAEKLSGTVMFRDYTINWDS